MENLASSSKYLAEKGLSVTQRSGTHLVVSRDNDRVLDLVEVNDGYKVLSWEYVPGPGEDDFSFIVPTLDEALLIAWSFYFSEPVEISGWVLPVHRKPYWSLPKIQYRLANATHVNSEQLASIREKRERQAVSHPSQPQFGAAFAECTQFILAGTRRDSGAQFFVRRDLEEAYVLTNA